MEDVKQIHRDIHENADMKEVKEKKWLLKSDYITLRKMDGVTYGGVSQT